MYLCVLETTTKMQNYGFFLNNFCLKKISGQQLILCVPQKRKKQYIFFLSVLVLPYPHNERLSSDP